MLIYPLARHYSVLCLFMVCMKQPCIVNDTQCDSTYSKRKLTLLKERPHKNNDLHFGENRANA
jgi:hypothetical protein